MPEENKETKETPETPETRDNPNNGAPVPEDLEAIKAELEAERQAKAAAEASLAEKDALIATLQAQLSEAKTNLALTTEQLTDSVKLADQAVAKYLGAVKAANPAIPGDVIAGATIEDIDASLARAATIATAVRANLEAQAKEARVPAGAPPRGEISIEGLSPREKIAAGVKQKGGTT